ncbi:hypothetical protein BAUCODRAFT_127504 [Baudoinia panamericana UAMH 10762]|uniref:Uncharacterized protein n=1 Tax=Baudoinia panamericana (strain UAMH 10762) TaxID=717646 RepID=M2MXS8_BAUPA|nr:uncharacterized protein BAUCODRAFT_127504 [Baudoinia panamericana UAMH 10762]EMC91050.1 hypothetical protein BAUCODRAFT_127504 [Baudoinia panamericana UAMH 10762]
MSPVPIVRTAISMDEISHLSQSQQDTSAMIGCDLQRLSRHVFCGGHGCWGWVVIQSHYHINLDVARFPPVRRDADEDSDLDTLYLPPTTQVYIHPWTRCIAAYPLHCRHCTTPWTVTANQYFLHSRAPPNRAITSVTSYSNDLVWDAAPTSFSLRSSAPVLEAVRLWQAYLIQCCENSAAVDRMQGGHLHGAC